MCEQTFNADLHLKSDIELLKLYRFGKNQSAVTILIARYASLINKKTALCHIKGIDNDDIRQEAYVGLYSAIATYSEGKGAAFKTYAAHCIANKLKNLFAAATTNKAEIYKNTISLEDIANSDLAEQKQLNPESIFIQKEGYEALLLLTNSLLSAFEKEVMFLHLSGCDYAAIATKLDSSKKSVDNALQRARKKLKAVLNNL